MKKILALLLMMCLFLVGCGNSQVATSSSSTDATSETSDSTDVASEVTESSDTEETTESKEDVNEYIQKTAFEKITNTLGDYFSENSDESATWGLSGDYEDKNIVITVQFKGVDTEGLTVDERKQVIDNTAKDDFFETIKSVKDKYEEYGFDDVKVNLVVYDENKIMMQNYEY